MRLLSFFLILHLTLVNAVSPAFSHAALGCVTGAVASGDCAGGAAGAVAGEIAAELFVTNWTKSVLKRAQAGELTRQELANEIASLDSKAINIASLTGGLMAALVGGDVNAGSAAGSNAAEYNALCGGICVAGVVLAAGAIYATVVGEGNPLDGLEQFGAGNDPLSQTIASGIAQGVELSMEYFPEQTLAAINVLEAIGEASNIVVEYVDKTTGKRVSTNWNNLPQSTRNQLKGGAKLFSLAIPAGTVTKLTKLKNARMAGKAGNRLSIPDDLPTNIHMGQQGKHIRGHNNFQEGRSYFNDDVNPSDLLVGVHSGQYPVVGTGSRGNPIVDFGRPIGIDGRTGQPVTRGQIHYGNNGAHIVPDSRN